MVAQIVLATCFAVLAVAHSALGEAGILRPLFAAEWATSDIPRWAMEAILRFAWHLTSMAWVAVAVIALDVDASAVLGVLGVASAALIFVMLRGHLAWPIFLLGGLAGLRGADLLPDGVLMAAAIMAIVGLGAASLLHVYWAGGGRWFFDRAAPPGEWGVKPGPVITLAVAAALAGFAALIGAVVFTSVDLARWPVIAGIAALALRAVGDGKVVGFSKSDRTTAFAADDDRLFTPIIVFLALGALASLIL